MARYANVSCVLRMFFWPSTACRTQNRSTISNLPISNESFEIRRDRKRRSQKQLRRLIYWRREKKSRKWIRFGIFKFYARQFLKTAERSRVRLYCIDGCWDSSKPRGEIDGGNAKFGTCHLKRRTSSTYIDARAVNIWERKKEREREFCYQVQLFRASELDFKAIFCNFLLYVICLFPYCLRVF
jgi:hypothetical protein